MFAGFWDRLSRVVALGGSETNHFRTAKGKCRNNKHRAEAVDGVFEGAWVVPVLGSDVALLSDATAVDDDAEDDEADTRKDFDRTKDELN